MLQIYGIPACDTVKKARAYLDTRGVGYQFHDYKKRGITREKLESWLAQRPWEELFNRAGTTYPAGTPSRPTRYPRGGDGVDAGEAFGHPSPDCGG